MSNLRSLASAIICLTMLLNSGAASGAEPNQTFRLNRLNASLPEQSIGQVAGNRVQKLLSDHPGSATALTATQKSEIKSFIKKTHGREVLVCAGLSLTGQRESMYRVVLLRADLVCEYAKSLNSSITTTIEARTTKERSHNGRILISMQRAYSKSKISWSRL